MAQLLLKVLYVLLQPQTSVAHNKPFYKETYYLLQERKQSPPETITQEGQRQFKGFLQSAGTQMK